MSGKKLLIVIPCYNEEEALPSTLKRMETLMNKMLGEKLIDKNSRVMFVDDGSRDRTWEIISELAKGDEHYIGISQSRNRGHQNALLAGLTSTLLWNYVLGKPWGVDGTMVGMLCNFLVFTACTKAYQRYDVQKIRVWK